MADKPAPHYYGGQALLEGVMMRGRETWAVAVRRPSQEIWLEKHPVRGLAAKHPIFRKPMFRGIAAMSEALSIGMRAMMISANQSLEEEEQLTRKQMAGTIAFALVMFIGIFIVLPNLISNIGGPNLTDAQKAFCAENPGGRYAPGQTCPGSQSLGRSVREGIFRLVIFLGYLFAISFVKEIRRVFQYHGAEHKTIAAYEANEPVLEPAAVDKYSTLHVRCGTNFLIITMLLTVVAYTFLGRPALWIQLVERIGGIFILAGIAYEGLRLGAAHGDNPIVRALMKPGLWLQKITTKPPTHDQIEVAIRSFEAVLPEEERSRVAPLPSQIVTGNSLRHLEEEQDIIDPVQPVDGESDGSPEP